MHVYIYYMASMDILFICKEEMKGPVYTNM
jgi:hypothetical protein